MGPKFLVSNSKLSMMGVFFVSFFFVFCFFPTFKYIRVIRKKTVIRISNLVLEEQVIRFFRISD